MATIPQSNIFGPVGAPNSVSGNLAPLRPPATTQQVNPYATQINGSQAGGLGLNNFSSTQAVAPTSTGNSIWQNIGGAISNFLGTNQYPQTPTPARPTTASNPLVSTANATTPPARPTSSSGQSSGQIDYTLHPGESIDAYNSRIAGARTQSGGTTQSTPSPVPAPQPTQPVQDSSAGYYQGNYDQQGNQIGNNTTVQSFQSPIEAQAPQADQTDRFNQIKALEDKAQTAGQMTPEEIAAQEEINQLNASEALGLAKITGNPEPLELQTGQSNVLRQQALGKSNLLTSQLALAQARRQAALGGVQTAIGAEQNVLGLQQPVSTSPGQSLISPTTGQVVGGNSPLGVQVPYGTQYLDPRTGQPLGGGSTGGGSQQMLDNAVQQLKNGAAFSDVAGQLPGGLSSLLLNAAQQQIPGFNITTSNQNAQARGSALQNQVNVVRPLVQSQQVALEHLQGLKDLVGKVNYSNSGIWNNARNWWSDNANADPNVKNLQSQIGLVQEEIAKILGGGTATDSSRNDARAILPANLSPNNFDSVMSLVQQRMQEKIDQMTNLNNVQQYGQDNQPTQSNQSQGGLYNF